MGALDLRIAIEHPPPRPSPGVPEERESFQPWPTPLYHAALSRILPTVVLIARRFLWIAAFAFWMGGFSFYGGVVITIGANVVSGGEREFGFITRQVTNRLNLIGCFALFIFLIDLMIDWRTDSRRLRWMTLALWIGLAILHAYLIVIHSRMDRLLDPQTLAVHHQLRFRQLHTAYLGISTIEWAGCLVLLTTTLCAWQQRDHTDSESPMAPPREADVAQQSEIPV